MCTDMHFSFSALPHECQKLCWPREAQFSVQPQFNHENLTNIQKQTGCSSSGGSSRTKCEKPKSPVEQRKLIFTFLSCKCFQIHICNHFLLRLPPPPPGHAHTTIDPFVMQIIKVASGGIQRVAECSACGVVAPPPQMEGAYEGRGATARNLLEPPSTRCRCVPKQL